VKSPLAVLLVTAVLGIASFSAEAIVDDLQQAKTAVVAKHWHYAEIHLERWLGQQSEDDETRFLLARVLAWQGKYRKSLGHYQILLRREPKNSDYLLGLAQLHDWQGRPKSAIPLLRKALALTPTYADVWEVLVRVLAKTGHSVEAEHIRRQAKVRFPTRKWPKPIPISKPAKTPNPTPFMTPETFTVFVPPENIAVPVVLPLPEHRENTVEMGGSYETLSRGFVNWGSLYLAGSHRFGDRKTFYARVTDSDRFAMHDTSILLGSTHPISERWTLNLETDDSPTFHFLPQWSVMGSFHYRMDYGFGVLFGLRHASYRDTENQTGNFSLERYWDNWRAAYTLYISQLVGAPSPSLSHLGQISYYYDDQSYFGISMGAGKQVISLGPGQIGNSDTKTHHLQGQHWLSPSWALIYDAGVEVQGTSYTRRGANLSIRHAF